MRPLACLTITQRRIGVEVTRINANVRVTFLLAIIARIKTFHSKLTAKSLDRAHACRASLTLILKTATRRPGIIVKDHYTNSDSFFGCF